MTAVSEQVDVLIPLGDRCLALSQDQFVEALRRGRELMGENVASQAAPTDRVLDAEGMEAETKIPATWFLQQARCGKIPHVRAGKYVRFERAKVLEALRTEPRHAERLSANRRKLRAIP